MRLLRRRLGLRRQAVALVALACAVVVALQAGQALGRPAMTGTCSSWDITGSWQTLQSNTYRASWSFSQRGTTLTGSVTIPQADAATQGFTGRTGTIVRGSLIGSKLDVVVRWPAKTDGTVISGEYTGTVEEGPTSGTGQVRDGETWNVAAPSSKATWTGHGSAKCQEAWRYVLTYDGPTLYGHGEGRKMPRGKLVEVSGSIADQGCVPYLCRGCPASPCSKPALAVPAVSMAVTDGEVSAAPLTVSPPERKRWTPPMERILTLSVKVVTSSKPNACPPGDTGTVVLTDRDLTTADGINGSQFKIGGWSRPCLGHTYVLDATTTGAVGVGSSVDKPGAFFVNVEVDCLNESGNGWSEHACH